jgi:hypothetical protein
MDAGVRGLEADARGVMETEEPSGILAPVQRLEALRARAQQLKETGAVPASLRLEEAATGWQQLREVGRQLVRAAAETYGPLCPEGYPTIEDNGIDGPGGSVGVRFSIWHAFHFAFQHAKKRKKAEPKPTGLAGALDIRVKRMPGDPLPPRDPNDRFELVTQGLRWDEDRGWVETRFVLPVKWTEGMLLDLLAAYLAGFNLDVAAGLPARRET